MSIVSATPENITAGAQLLRAGRLVAFPTETVYGLGGDATNDRAVASIFATKGRPSFNPLIIHVPTIEEAARLVDFDERARRLADAVWPGPLTLVLPRRQHSPVSLLASAGLDSLAVRIPDHPIALELLRATGCPVAAPSANPSGRVSPTTARHVADHVESGQLAQDVPMILDGGPCEVGVESTVLDLTGSRPTLLRPGGIPRETLQQYLGPIAVARAVDVGGPKSPGMLESHYAPTLPVRIEAESAVAGEALLGFGPGVRDAMLNLSPTGDLAEAAANLFAMLRALDRPTFRGIAVMSIPDHGLGAAINDRLRRAATR
jgi:L-threonylcarbamoyladenylate synthase